MNFTKTSNSIKNNLFKDITLNSNKLFWFTFQKKESDLLTLFDKITKIWQTQKSLTEVNHT